MYQKSEIFIICLILFSLCSLYNSFHPVKQEVFPCNMYALCEKEILMKNDLTDEEIFLPDIFRPTRQSLNDPQHEIGTEASSLFFNSTLLSILINGSIRYRTSLEQAGDKRNAFATCTATDYFALMNESSHASSPDCKLYNIEEQIVLVILFYILTFALTIEKKVTCRKSWSCKFPFGDIVPHQRTLTLLPFSLNQYAKEIVTEHRSNEELMKFEWSRYLSFKTFPVSSVMTPIRLAQAGFYYTGRGEEVRCFCCAVTNSEWNTQENALQVHLRLSPNCDFIRNNPTNNVPIHFQEYYQGMVDNIQLVPGTQAVASGGPSDIASNGHASDEICSATAAVSSQIQEDKTPSENEIKNETSTASTTSETVKHPEYADSRKREESFSGWTLHDIQPPRQLISAGFFYTGVKDFLRCFYCVVGLKNWQKGDNPWTEHARWSSKCGHLKQYGERTGNGKTAGEQTSSSREQPQKLNNSAGRERSCVEDARAVQEENRILRQQMTCKICLESPADTVFLPCGHMTTCQACAARQNHCTHCQQQIKGTVRVYQS